MYYVNGLGAALCFSSLSQPLKSPHRHSENSLSAFTAFLLVHLTLSEERPSLTLESGWPLNSVCGDKGSLWRAQGEGGLSPSPTPPAQQLQPWPGVQGVISPPASSKGPAAAVGLVPFLGKDKSGTLLSQTLAP